MPRFTLFHVRRVERSLVLDVDEIRIGRLPGVEVELPSPTISREHARIRRDGDKYILEDAGSVNGVYVRGRRVQECVLVAGDTIRIEEYALVFEPPDDLFQAGVAAAGAETDGDPKAVNPDMTFLNIAKFLPDED